MKKSELKKLADALDLAGYEIERIGPIERENVNQGTINREYMSDGFTLSITPIREKRD